MKRTSQHRREARIVKRLLESQGATFINRPYLFDFDDRRWIIEGPDPLNIASRPYRLNNGNDLTVKIAFDQEGTIWYFSADPTQVRFLVEEISTKPPATAEWLLGRLLTPAERDGAIGDFNEKFALVVDRDGRPEAIRWAYSELIQSAWPLLKRLLSLAILSLNNSRRQLGQKFFAGWTPKAAAYTNLVLHFLGTASTTWGLWNSLSEPRGVQFFYLLSSALWCRGTWTAMKLLYRHLSQKPTRGP